MNKLLQKILLAQFEPGVRYNGFYMPPGEALSSGEIEINRELQNLNMVKFEPGTRYHDGFYSPSYFSELLPSGSRCEEEHGYYVYVWDEEQQKHVRRWVE